MAERRKPPVLGTPQSIVLTPEDSRDNVKSQLKRWSDDVNAILAKMGRHHVAAYDSLPAPHQETHLVGGSDEFDEPAAPTTITPDATADIGDGPSYAREDHTHAIATATASALVAGTAASTEGTSSSFARADHIHATPSTTPVGLANSNVEGTSSWFSRADHQHKRDVRVQYGGADVGTRNKIDLQANVGMVVTVTDDSVNDKVTADFAVKNPPSAKGQIWTHNGTTQTQLAAPADFRILEGNTGATEGVQWSTLVTILGRLLTTRSDIVTRDGTGVTRLGAGADGTSLRSNSASGDLAWDHPFTYWGYKDLTDNVASTVFTIVTTDNQHIHQKWAYTVTCVNASNSMQVEMGEVLIVGRNPTGSTPSVTITQTAHNVILDSGTLTVTVSSSVASDTVSIRVTADTSLTPSSLYVQMCGVYKVDDSTVAYA